MSTMKSKIPHGNYRVSVNSESEIWRDENDNVVYIYFLHGEYEMVVTFDDKGKMPSCERSTDTAVK